jgi:hypothetical protein
MVTTSRSHWDPKPRPESQRPNDSCRLPRTPDYRPGQKSKSSGTPDRGLLRAARTLGPMRPEEQTREWIDIAIEVLAFRLTYASPTPSSPSDFRLVTGIANIAVLARTRTSSGDWLDRGRAQRPPARRRVVRDLAHRQPGPGASDCRLLRRQHVSLQARAACPSMRILRIVRILFAGRCLRLRWQGASV